MNAKQSLLATLCALALVACGHRSEPAATPAAPAADRVTKEELESYLDWQVELRNQMKSALAESQRNLDDPAGYQAMFERRRKEQQEIFAREPLKGTPKRDAIGGVLQALYGTGSYVHDDAELEKTRTRYGKELVDSILEHEELIREKLGTGDQNRIQ